MTSFSQIIGMDVDGIQKEIVKSSHDLVNLTMAIRVQQEKNTAKKKKSRRYIARLKTAQRMNELKNISITPNVI